ncbi:MAG: hypothetical protein LBK66_00305 [Spirochaetaceae bacterium]|nr:hypothetical protein [Spirochaetaceae bacterium]
MKQLTELFHKSNEGLEYIDNLKNELDGLCPLSKELVIGLKQLFDVDFTYNSMAIEGNTFSFQETKMLLMERINYLDAIESWQQDNNKEKFYETIKERIIWK